MAKKNKFSHQNDSKSYNQTIQTEKGFLSKRKQDIYSLKELINIERKEKKVENFIRELGKFGFLAENKSEKCLEVKSHFGSIILEILKLNDKYKFINENYETESPNEIYDRSKKLSKVIKRECIEAIFKMAIDTKSRIGLINEIEINNSSKLEHPSLILFREKENRKYMIWESFSSNKATYIFLNAGIETDKKLIAFIASDFLNKRKYLYSSIQLKNDLSFHAKINHEIESINWRKNVINSLK